MSRVDKVNKRKEKRAKDKKIALVKKEVTKITEIKRLANQFTDEDVIKRQQVIESYKSERIASMNLIADRNGCGYYRCIWPMEILATKADVQVLNTFVHVTDFGVLKHLNSIKFQRQSDLTHCRMMDYYISERNRLGYKYKIQYEIDDLLPEVDESNTVAYDYFIKNDRVKYHLEAMHKSDAIIVSTDTLKDVYSTHYNMPVEKITVIKNNLPRFLYNFNRRHEKRTFDAHLKPRVFWSGSGSHVGKDGDLDFFVKIVESTLDKYTWVLQGVCHPDLQKHVDAGKIEFHAWSSIYDLPSLQFNICKPDVYLTTLKPSRFCACKSDLKFLEASSLGVPFIGTSFTKDPSYQEYPSPYDNTDAITLANGDVDEWVSKIDELCNSNDAYMDQVNKQYTNLQGRWMEGPTNIQQWMDSLFLGR
jgi:hypothetical protein